MNIPKRASVHQRRRSGTGFGVAEVEGSSAQAGHASHSGAIRAATRIDTFIGTRNRNKDAEIIAKLLRGGRTTQSSTGIFTNDGRRKLVGRRGTLAFDDRQV